MFYYAEINSEYQVINKYCLSEESTNPNYILITEDLYNNGNELGDIVGQFYNALLDVIEIVDPEWDMGQTCWMRYKDSQMRLSTKLDNMDKATSLKADISHTHEGYANSDDLQALEDVIDTKASNSHVHSEYSLIGHTHDNYATQVALDTLSVEVDEKADISHTHSEYAPLTHSHDAYSPLVHSHTEYATQTSLDSAVETLESEIDGKANENHIHNNYATVNDLNELSSIVSSKANAVDLNSHASDTELHISESEREYWNAKSDFSGSYNDLTNKPTIPSIDGLATEDYVDGKVGAITVESIGALPNTTVIPTVPTNVSAFVNDAGYLTEHQSLDGLATETYVNTQINAIDIPSALSDLTADSTHRVVTDTEKATWNAKSDFSGSYNDLTDKPSIPSISGLATETYVDEAVTVKADSNHNHNSIYYTETEIDNLLSGKANSNHNHNSSYDALGTAETKANAIQANLDVVSEDLAEHIDNADIHFTTAERNKLSGIAANANNYTHPNSGVTAGTYKSVTVNAQGHITSGANPTTLAGYGITDAETKGAANSALISAKAYADELIADEVTNRNSAIATAKSSAISTAASDATTKANNALASAKTYADNAAATVKNDLLNNAGSAYDTLKELGDLIDDNADAIEALETIASGKANASHTHAISDVTGLQTALDSKANASHGTHVSYSTTAPVMDGTASVGSASTVARSDHKHPTDTSRAAQTSLDSHTSNKSNPHGVTLAQLGLTATAAELNVLDGITATVTELNFVDGVTSNIQTQLNSKAASSHTHTIANITNLQSTLDGKAASSHTHKVANISDLTATATELNYMDGVTSNVQTQLDGKAALSHNHSASNITSGTLSSDRLSTVPISKGGTGATTAAGALTNLGITATASELNYVDGVTSNIQTQLNGKSSTSHTHNYAGSSSAGGAATSAEKLSNYVNLTSSGSANVGKFIKFGTITLPSIWASCCGYLVFNTRESASGCVGILRVYVRLSSTIDVETVSLQWISTNNTKYANAVKLVKTASGVFDLYMESMGTYEINEITGIFGADSNKVVLQNSATWVDSIDADYQSSLVSVSSSCTGNAATATTATKVGTSTVGGTTQPVYINGGTPTACTYTLGKSVPSDAKFTDTTYNAATTSTAGLMSASDKSKLDNITASADSVSFSASATSGNKVGAITINGTTTNMYSPTQTSVSGNAGTATKLATARTISLAGDVTGSTSFDGSGNVSITATVADDSHNHTIANVDGLQTALDGKSATSHTHTAQSLVSMAEALFATSYNGGVEYSYGSGSGKNVLTEISNMPAGLHTIYSIAGTTGNPKTTESWRMLVHKTSATIGWVLAFDAEGSIYSNYQSAAGTFKGWRCIYDVTPPILWMGEYWCTDTQTVTPSKALSACRNGWVLVWSDYDTANEVSTNGDCFTTVIPKWNPNHVKWSGQSFIAAVPTNLSTDGTISFAGKRLYVHDTKITGNTVNDVSPSNDVCLRAIYEY